MLVEHIIEPDFLVKLAESRRNCRDFIREFTKPSPRVISNFPKLKNLRRTAIRLQSTEVGEQERERLIEMIRFIQGKTRVERSCAYDGAVSHCDNCIQAHSRIKTDLLVLKDKIAKFPVPLVSIDDFEEGIDALPTQVISPKTVDAMTKAMVGLLRTSKYICFVDPYFNDRVGMWDPMISFIRASLENSPVNEKHIQIVYNNDAPRAATAKRLMDRFDVKAAELKQQLTSLTFKAIREKDSGEKLHNRYVITELGAVSWGIGLDSDVAHYTDDVILLNEALYQARYSQYVELDAFIVVDEEKYCL